MNINLQGFSNKQQKTEIQFVTGLGYSNLSQVNHLLKQIMKGSLKKKVKPTSMMLLDSPPVPV